jgi:hypothetical protein
MTALLVNTPCYVLLDGKQRLGPQLLRPHAGPEGVAIYGFSDKPPYDLFCANSELALTPYPLVKGYLKNQIADSGDAIRLVVVDAAGPNETQLNAATMESVLEAQEQKAARVTISFHLMLDRGSQAYRVEKASSGPGRDEQTSGAAESVAILGRELS